MCTVGVAAMAMDETRPERESRTMSDDDEMPCVLDECRFFDTATGEWGYEVLCVSAFHGHRESCPGEHEMMRFPAAAVVGAGTDKETP
jgi:hypothetical protein